MGVASGRRRRTDGAEAVVRERVCWSRWRGRGGEREGERTWWRKAGRGVGGGGEDMVAKARRVAMEGVMRAWWWW